MARQRGPSGNRANPRQHRSGFILIEPYQARRKVSRSQQPHVGPVMQALQTLIPLIITASLSGLVLAVGLHSGRGDLLYVLRRPGLLARAVLAVLVIPPIAAGLVISTTRLEPVVMAGIMLMAISPVPPLVPGKEIGVGGRKEYAYGLYVAMALLTTLSVPIVMAVVTLMFGRQDFADIGSIVRTVVFSVLIPLSVGVVIRQVAPAFAERAWSIIYKLSMVLVLVAFLPIVIRVWPALSALIGNGAVVAMALVTLIALAGGHVLGGPDRHDRATLATCSAVRHPGIAISLAGAHFHDPAVSAAILLFLLVGLVVSAPYTAWIKRGARRPPAHA